VRLLNRLFPVRMAVDLDSDGSLRDHVIIAGYGLTGESVARLLKDRDIPYIIVDLNIDNVTSAKAQAELAYFGDVTSVEVLEHIGAPHARMLVLSINDHDATVHAIAACRRVAPKLRIIARARFAVDVQALERAGATIVIAAELAAADEVVDCVAQDLDSRAAPA
jgi:CPA2 family monovalent cation:H+ antiporter-2